MRLLIALILALFYINIYGQSTIGVSGGRYIPIFSTPPNSYNVDLSVTNGEGYYAGIHFQERVHPTFNLGFRAKFTHQKFKYLYSTSTSGHFGYSNSKLTANYSIKFINLLINLEARPFKNGPLYIYAGPAFDILFSSYKDEEGNRKGSGFQPPTAQNPQGTHHYYDESWNEDNIKNNDVEPLRISLVYGVSLEISKSIFIRSQFNYSFTRLLAFPNIKSCDLLVGIGFQFGTPNFAITKSKKKNER